MPGAAMPRMANTPCPETDLDQKHFNRHGRKVTQGKRSPCPALRIVAAFAVKTGFPLKTVRWMEGEMILATRHSPPVSYHQCLSNSSGWAQSLLLSQSGVGL